VTARQISSSAVADVEFRYSDLLPTGQDDTPYRLITTEGVSTFEANGRTFLQVDPEALRLLTAEAMHDIAHYLRPAHLQQLRKIIDGRVLGNSMVGAGHGKATGERRGRREPASTRSRSSLRTSTPTGHRNLVPQDEQLRVLGAERTADQHRPSRHLAERNSTVVCPPTIRVRARCRLPAPLAASEAIGAAYPRSSSLCLASMAAIPPRAACSYCSGDASAANR
jgi:hypothetical protein